MPGGVGREGVVLPCGRHGTERLCPSSQSLDPEKPRLLRTERFGGLHSFGKRNVWAEMTADGLAGRKGPS